MTTKPQLNVRVYPWTIELVNALASQLGVSQAGVVNIAVRLLAKREGITLEKNLKKSTKTT